MDILIELITKSGKSLMKVFVISVVLLFLITGQTRENFKLTRICQPQNQLKKEVNGGVKMSINKDQLRDLITETLKEVNLYSESAVELLMGTAAVESNLGTYIKQVKGPALGIFQIEPKTHADYWDNFLNSRSIIFYPQKEKDDNLKGYELSRQHDEVLVYNLKYSIVMARIHYLRFREPLPKADDIVGLAQYWKIYFNSSIGKGKTSDFIKKYNKYVRV